MAQEKTSPHSFTTEESDISWIESAVDQSPKAFFDTFSLSNKMLAHQRYLRMVKNSNMDENTKKILLSKFETWKVNHATEFWVNRRIQSSQIRTAATLVEGSEPYADLNIHRNATQARNAMANSKNTSTSSSSSSNTNGEYQQQLTMTENIPNSGGNKRVIDKYQTLLASLPTECSLPIRQIEEDQSQESDITSCPDEALDNRKRKITVSQCDTGDTQTPPTRRPRTYRNETPDDRESIHIELEDFLKKCPNDTGPISFFDSYALGSPHGKSIWSSVYVSLFHQALKSQDPDLYKVGQKMREQWELGTQLIESYWDDLERNGVQTEELMDLCDKGNTYLLLGPNLPSEYSGSDFICPESVGRSSINSIDIRTLNFIFDENFLTSHLTQEMRTSFKRFEPSDFDIEESMILSRSAVFASTNEYLPAKTLIRSLPSGTIIKEILLEMTSTAALFLPLSSLPVNEDSYIHHKVRAILVGLFGDFEIAYHWTRDQLPTPTGYEEIYQPDFYGERNGFPFIIAEVKKPDADPSSLDHDSRKLPQMMKLALNRMCDAGVRSPVVVGFLIQERRCEITAMNLPSEAIYYYQTIGSFEIPEDSKQLGLLLAALSILKTAKEIAMETLTSIIERPNRQSSIHPWTRPSFYLKGIMIPEALPPVTSQNSSAHSGKGDEVVLDVVTETNEESEPKKFIHKTKNGSTLDLPSMELDPPDSSSISGGETSSDIDNTTLGRGIMVPDSQSNGDMSSNHKPYQVSDHTF
ncbi:hypothetical protein BGZ76_002767 [Entomortierella beljakovae]|nr:hypothetical protein BGZ76_002767 [Entomortierella beljakovae]